MMSLVAAVPDQQLSSFLPPSTEVVPLVIRFSGGCVPLSCFSSTISCLLSTYNWRMSRREDSSPECLAHNIVSLYDPVLPVKIVLVDLTYHLEIHIKSEEQLDRDIFPEICSQVRNTIFGAIIKVFDAMKLTEIEVSPTFLCPCQKVSEAHSASVYRLKTRQFLRCSRTQSSVGEVQWSHTAWLRDDVPQTHSTSAPAGEPPSLPELFRLQLPQRIGTTYTTFGIILLNDKTGCRMESIVDECRGNPERVTQRVLQEWIAGRGLPVTWQTLIRTLRDSELTVLADQLCVHIHSTGL